MQLIKTTYRLLNVGDAPRLRSGFVNCMTSK